MEITSRSENGIMIFDLAGRVDSNGAGEMNAALQNAVEAGQYKIVLNMSNVSYINNAGWRISGPRAAIAAAV